MNWIEFCNYLFYAIFLTSITGGTFSLLWMILRKTILRNDCRLAGVLLRFTQQMYVIPILFVFLIVKYQDDILSLRSIKSDLLVRKQLFQTTPSIKLTITGCMSIWMIGLLGMMVYWTVCSVRLRREIRGSIPEDDSRVLELFCRIKTDLGIKKKIELLRNDTVRIPFTAGTGKCVVVLPFRNYTEQELCVVLAHELSHCRNHDLFYRLEMVWINTVHVINPLVYVIRKWMAEMMEYICDVNACEHCTVLFSAKEYFSVILNETIEDGKGPRYLTVALTESKNRLERRVHNMKRYQKKGAVRKSLAAVIITCFMLGGSMTAYAAGEEVVDVQNRWYEGTRDLSVESNSNVIEYVLLPDEVRDVPTVIIDDSIMPYTTININWDVPANTKYKTTAFHLDNGDTVGVTIKTTPSDKTVYVGLEYPDGSEHLVYCTGTVSHTFTVTQSGGFHFYIDNISSVTVHAEGSYVR